MPDRLDFWSGVTYPRSPGLVRKLLARGLDPNRPDWLGRTFLHACAENGDRSVAAVFLDAGADINARDLEFQGTPLAAAVRSLCATAGTPSRRSAATDGRVPVEARRRDQPARRRTVGHAVGLGTPRTPRGRSSRCSWSTGPCQATSLAGSQPGPHEKLPELRGGGACCGADRNGPHHVRDRGGLSALRGYVGHQTAHSPGMCSAHRRILKTGMLPWQAACQVWRAFCRPLL